MPNMCAVQVSRPGGPLELVERPIPDPEPGSVRIKVQACGICHSDVFTKEGHWPGITYPRVPGHEVIGLIDAVGNGRPARWQTGQRVGIGWHAWHCGSCDNCRRGDFFACQTGVQVTGISFDGGYADYMIAPATALALVPEELQAADGRAAHVRRPHHVQRAAEQRRTTGRSRRGPRRRRARPPRRPIRSQDGIPHRRNCPREGQGAARAATRCVPLHRQPGLRPRCRARRNSAAPRW